jgi:hypothetical protein
MEPIFCRLNQFGNAPVIRSPAGIQLVQYRALIVRERLGRTWVFSALLMILSFSGLNTAIAEESSVPDSRRTVSNYEMFNRSKSKNNSKIHYMQSEISLRNDDVNRAITMGRRAVRLDPEDIDARVALGEALYQKVKRQKKKPNPELYNECVKTWLMVLRNVVGDESKMSYKGISLPLAQRFFEDEDRGILARERLTEVCGRVPKFYETNNKFLTKVLLPEATKTVAGTVLKGSTSGDSESENVEK